MGCCTSNPSKKVVSKDVQLIDRNSRNSNGNNQASPFSTRGSNIPADSVTPHVWFVIKTRRDDKTKIFINLFYHEFIKSIYPIELSKSWDKKGDLCLVYGVVLPRATYMTAEKDSKVCNTVCMSSYIYFYLFYSY